jgi:hypothetical protein
VARTTATNFSGGLQFPYATAATDLFKKEDVQTLALAVDGHDHSTGKGLILPASAVPWSSMPSGTVTSAMIADGTIDTADLKDGSVTSAKILDGTIATADIVPHAVSFVFRSPGVTNGPSTTSTTAVDMPEMVYTFTPPAICDLYVDFFSGLQVTGAGAFALFTPLLDGASVGLGAYFQLTGANGAINCSFTVNSLSAASHTVKVQWQVSSGGTVFGLTTNRLLSVMGLMR